MSRQRPGERARPPRGQSRKGREPVFAAFRVRAGAAAARTYDFTSDDPSGGPLDTDYWATTARDGNATFSPRRRLTPQSFDMRTAPDAGGFFVGDYEGLTNTGNFLPVFVTAHSGNTANRTDVFSSAFSSSASSAGSAKRRVVARVSNRQSLARLVKRAGAIQGPVRIR